MGLTMKHLQKRPRVRPQIQELWVAVGFLFLMLVFSLLNATYSGADGGVSLPWGWLLLLVLLIALHLSDIPAHTSVQSVVRFVQHVRMPQYSDVLAVVSGRWLSPANCRITWGWQEPQTVGGTFSFLVELYHWNGSPYSLQDSNHLEIQILCEGHPVTPSIEPQTTPLGKTKVKVTLTVYKAGVYRMSVKLAGQHVQGSPTIKVFIPGFVDSRHTCVVSQLQLQVAMVSSVQQVCVQLRDAYHNTCAYNPSQDTFSLTLHEPDTGYEFTPPIQCSWLDGSERVCVKYTLPYTGVYTANLTYNNTSVQNSQYTVICLTENDMSSVTKHVAKQNSDCYYEARLIGNQDRDKGDKVKKVFCYLSPRQMTIKEFYMKIFPRRLHTFRICSAVKFTFLPPGGSQAAPCLVIEDGCQPAVTLSSKDRNLMVAVFASHMMRNIGGSETFKDKQQFFYFELRKLHAKRIHSRLSITVCRSQLLETSYRATRDFSLNDWCRNFEVTFKGEEGLDWGGVRREWVEVLCTHIFDPQGSGLFTQFQEDSQGLVLPNPRRPSHLKLKYYEFAGRLVGKCLYESSLGGGYRQLVKARFARSFLAQMIGLSLHYKVT